MEGRFELMLFVLVGGVLVVEVCGLMRNREYYDSDGEEEFRG